MERGTDGRAQRRTDLTLILEDRVGSLGDTFGALAAGAVDVVGHAGFPAWAGEGILHLVVDDADSARSALASAGIEVREERPVIAVAVDDRPGALAEVLAALAADGISVDLTYSLSDGHIALGVDALDRALEKLSEERP
jgi:hypothetical protein